MFTKKLKQLLDKIFNPNAQKRVSAKQILNDPWLAPAIKAHPLQHRRQKSKETQFENDGDQQADREAASPDRREPGEYVPEKTIRGEE